VLLFGRKAFKAVVSTGTVLAADGEKMSKSKGNYTDPLENLDRHGADALRLYFLGHVILQAEDMRFRDEELRDVHNRTIGILWNTFKFFDLYGKDYDGTDARTSGHVLDKWVLARLDEVVVEVTAAMEAYDTPRACRALRAFVDDYSTWYVRRSRERVKNEGADKQSSLGVQHEVLLTFSKLLAPITPFIAESIYRGILKEGSVHLQEWPEPHKNGFFARFFVGDNKDPLIEEMSKIRAIVSKALEARDKAGIKVRQPLAKLTIKNAGISEELRNVIKDEVNVKEVVQADIEVDVMLDTNITPELKEEGVIRETIRMVQDARKTAQLKPGEPGKVSISVSAENRVLIEKNLASIKLQTNTDITLS
jgi:isoleucyl-tRNA synthetase